MRRCKDEEVEQPSLPTRREHARTSMAVHVPGQAGLVTLHYTPKAGYLLDFAYQVTWSIAASTLYLLVYSMYTTTTGEG